MGSCVDLPDKGKGHVEWHDGNKLVEFELGAERSAGFGWRSEVQLTVEAKSGGTRKHLAVYHVDTEPAIVVVHEE